ncbi:MAG: hypothetical protein KF819_21385 [Labilithrix sp.]|nr:hypothetical protein [Labilithrix sp.]
MLSMLRYAAVVIPALLAAACTPTAVNSDPGPAVPVVEYVRQQEVLTPLPLRVRLPAKTGAEHVVVLFKTWGSRAWSGVELARDGQTWSGEVSCREVSTVTGDTRYFFVVFDAEGTLVGGSGSPDWPHVATIVGSLPDGAQSLSNGWMPMRCHDPADCPPDFPGCPAYAFLRRACRSNRDCGESIACAWDGYCGAPSREAPAVVRETEEEELEAAVRSISRKYRKTAQR